MTTKKLMGAATAVPVAISPPDPSPQERVEAVIRRAKLIALVGRGSRGKSILGSWIIQRARSEGNAALAVDCDRQNATLGTMIPDAIVPASGDEADVEAALAGTVERVAETREDVVVDMGGGDTVLRKAAMSQDFVTWLPTIGIDLTVIHVMGPSTDDCTSLISAEENGVLAASRTILVFNEGVVPGTASPAAAFAQTVERQAIVRATLERGAALCAMPRLPCIPLIEERRLSWVDAAANRAPEGVAPLGLWRAQQAQIWLRQMDVEFSGVRGWLP